MKERKLGSSAQERHVPVHYYEFVDRNSLRRGFLEDIKRRWISSSILFIENIPAVKRIYAENSKSSYTVTRGEEKLLNEHKKEIEHYIDKRKLVFWGAGRKEANLTNIANELRPGSQNAIVIDVGMIYMEDMREQITSSKNNAPLIGLHTLFESFLEDDPKQLLGEMIGKEPAMHVCLGTTIGNFHQDQIFRIFQENTKEGDLLMLGVQLEKDPEKIRREYVENDDMREFVQLKLFNDLEQNKIGKYSWNYNFEKHQIEYLFTFEKDYSFGSEEELTLRKGEKIEVFRSKKYQLPVLLNELKKYGFTYETNFQEDDKCLLLVKRQGKTSNLKNR